MEGQIKKKERRKEKQGKGKEGNEVKEYLTKVGIKAEMKRIAEGKKSGRNEVVKVRRAEARQLG